MLSIAIIFKEHKHEFMLVHLIMLESNSNLSFASRELIINSTKDSPHDQANNGVLFVLCEVCFWTATFIRLNRLTDLEEIGCSNCKEKQFFVGYPANK